MKAIKKLMLCLAIAGMLLSCEDDTSNPIPPSGNMVLNLENLEVLPAGWTYEAWLVVGGEEFSAGQFKVDPATGGLDNETIPVLSEKLESADAFFISIESTTDGDPAATGVKVLTGDFSQYEASLRHDNEEAIGVDLTDPANYRGYYLVAAPTSTTVEDDTSGIWFIENSGGSNAVGLTLPTLNANWVYEGWVIINGVAVSTGRFDDGFGADESCTYCGPLAGPPFPGEDFLTNAPAGLSFPANLAGATTVISVEPEPDFSPAPYTIKILSADIPSSQTIIINHAYSMDAVDAVVPSGTVLRFFGFNCTGEGCS